MRQNNNAISRRRFFDEAAQHIAGGLLGLGIVAESGSLAIAQAPAVSQRSLISRLSGFAANARYDALPPKAVENAKAAILDCLGVAVAGGKEESAQISGRLVLEEKAREETTVYGQRFRTSAAQAAFVNGIAAHAHDFDHSFVVGGQPTSPIIPATFALGEAVGASGRRIIEAYIAGFEVTASMIFAVQGAGGPGWHANGTIGVFGASAACCKLLGMKEPQIETALAIAASMASGVQSNFGTMTKPMHVGQAARNGVLSARLAAGGFTANTQTLEARNGFLQSYYPNGKPDLTAFENLGRTYSMERYGVRFKPYPCGGLTHTAIYAAIQLRNEHAITPDLVEHVSVEVPAETATTVAFRVPRSGLEGKFSMPYLIARALTDGNIVLETFTDEAARNKDVLALLERVEMKVDPALVSGSDGSRPATVTIRLKDGRTRALQQNFPKGSPQVPMTADERIAKYRACARPVLGDTASERALSYLNQLEMMTSVTLLTALLRG